MKFLFSRPWLPLVGFVLALLLLAANMRGSLVVVGPLVESIGRDLSLSSVQMGLLTTVPILCFGLLSVMAPRIAGRHGLELTLWGALALVAVGQGLRAVDHYTVMLLGTVILGAAIALMNVLTPSLVRRSFPSRIALMTGVYTLTMSSVGALAAFSAVPLRDAMKGNWQYPVGLWALFAAAAFLLWLPMLRFRHRADVPDRRSVSLWRNTEAWWLSVFFGCQSMVFYTCIAWLAKVFADAGMSEAKSGTLLTLYNLFGIPATFLAPLIYTRMRNKALAMALLHVPAVVGVAGFVLATTEWPYVWAICMGLGQGSMISVALTLIGIRGADAPTAASLSGMCQSVGYLMAAVGPVLFGALHDGFGSWQVPLWLLMAVMIAQFGTALRAGAPRLICPRD
ncbi:CynX/NimT family MFS transporter [Marinimicrobium sp. ARAG 43.8]|uniref:CynX/NimT family MFS transporter n=1 Tax=Marinimicrobium sp. ARAG 43.8 TaxID=3418719 RepID=UPI003CF4418F